MINVGVSGPGVVKMALEKVRGENFDTVAETIKKTAFKITRMGQLVAQEASRRLGGAVRHRGSFPCSNPGRSAIAWRGFSKNWVLKAAEPPALRPHSRF